MALMCGVKRPAQQPDCHTAPRQGKTVPVHAVPALPHSFPAALAQPASTVEAPNAAPLPEPVKIPRKDQQNPRLRPKHWLYAKDDGILIPLAAFIQG
jgi:hypothetical protein